MTLIYLPGWTGIKLRQLIYKPFFKSCGTKVWIESGVQLSGFKHISIGSNVHIDKNCIIQTGTKTIGHQKKKENTHFKGNAGEIIIGNTVHIVQNCMLFGYGGLQIGNNCTISASSKIYSQSNLPKNPENKSEIVSIMPYSSAHFILSPVFLGDNVWLGLNSIIMPGSSILSNSFVVSNSLVMDEHAKNSHIQGQPAKTVKKRFE
jgi:acetyltransferase-like isoleucine patch superfamily enzyme